MKIRKAKESDAGEISKLITEVVSNNFSGVYSDNVIKYFCEQNSVKNILKKMRQNVKYFVVENKGEIIGVAGIKKNRIVSFHIDVKHQKQGIGKQLMFYIENYAKDNFVKKLKVYSSLPAVKFYQKCGFKVVKKVLHSAPNSDKYVTVLMEKKISD
jgi:N-acetylglutamate synthase-like GNAT family acetyltransferase